MTDVIHLVGVKVPKMNGFFRGSVEWGCECEGGREFSSPPQPDSTEKVSICLLL